MVGARALVLRAAVSPLLVATCVCTLPAAPAPIFSGVTRGVLLECDAPGAFGQFSIRAGGSNEVYRFAFDAKTYLERENRRISIGGLQKGDTVEVVSDRDENVPVHYARTVHVIETHPAPRLPLTAGRLRMYHASPADLIAPRGNITFSGVVTKLTTDRVVLHTRLDGVKTVLLRLDTRYLESGTVVDAADLKPSTRVFVRAGKNLDDQVEAYQIIWGDILTPVNPR
ncbi:MAG: hypothetical protein JWO48_2208 [Bryobacterales bacterium]|nr:hypothetical protein [Bryobacterales bacterium]